MTPRQAADLRLRLAAERLQRANDELDAAEREHVLAAAAVPTECNCAARTCHPKDNVGRFCWRSGCPIYARDFPPPSTSIPTHSEDK